MPAKTEIVPGYLVACMMCHNGKPHIEYTPEAAQTWADIHLSDDCGKPRAGHEVTITETKVVRRATDTKGK